MTLSESSNSASWTIFGTFKIAGSWSWRVPSALQGLPSIFQILLVLWAPESPRWLVNKGRDADAIRTLAYYHADGNEQDPLVQYEYEEIRSALEFDRSVAANVGYKSLFTTRGNLKRMRIIIAIAFFSQWSGNGLISYYLNKVMNQIGITSNTTQLLIQGLLAIWNLGWAVFASFMGDRAGRRFLFITSCAGMLLFWTLQTACFGVYSTTGSQAAAHAFIAFIFCYYAMYDLAFTPLIVSYTVEILPYAIRAKGFNVFNFTVSLSLIFNQYVNPVAFKKMGWKYYVSDSWDSPWHALLTPGGRSYTAAGSSSSSSSSTSSSLRPRAAPLRRRRRSSMATRPRLPSPRTPSQRSARSRGTTRRRFREFRFPTHSRCCRVQLVYFLLHCACAPSLTSSRVCPSRPSQVLGSSYSFGLAQRLHCERTESLGPIYTCRW
jgi:MFS family permease